MKKLLAKIWSYSFLLPITDDDNFGTNELEKTNKTSYRISLIAFFWGHMAKYFITYNFKQKKFSLYHKIILEECGDLKELNNYENIKNKADTYEERIKESNISSDDIDIESEFIKYYSERQQGRLDIGERKINLYATVVLAIIPILLALFDIKTFLEYTIWEKILAIYVFYFLANVALLIFDSMKVKSYIFSRFSDLKVAINKRERGSRNLYFDWQAKQASAEILISYVLNIENMIKYAILLAVLLTFSVSMRAAININNIKMNRNIESQVITIKTDQLNNPYSQESIQMSELKLSIQKKQCENVMILIPEQNSLNLISQCLEDFSEDLITYHIDDTLEKNTVKIIKE